MGYIKDYGHFENFIKKVIRENANRFDEQKMLLISTYAEELFPLELESEFTYQIRYKPELLEEENFDVWLSGHVNGIPQIPGVPIIKRPIGGFTDEFVLTLQKLMGRSGVYSFWLKGVVLYVGTSSNLGSRIQGSYNEKISRLDGDFQLRYVATESASDAVVLEAFYIASLKPELNGIGKYPDPLSLMLVDLPAFGGPIQIREEG